MPSRRSEASTRAGPTPRSRSRRSGSCRPTMCVLCRAQVPVAQPGVARACRTQPIVEAELIRRRGARPRARAEQPPPAAAGALRNAVLRQLQPAGADGARRARTELNEAALPMLHVVRRAGAHIIARGPGPLQRGRRRGPASHGRVTNQVLGPPVGGRSGERGRAAARQWSPPRSGTPAWPVPQRGGRPGRRTPAPTAPLNPAVGARQAQPHDVSLRGQIVSAERTATAFPRLGKQRFCDAGFRRRTDAGD